MKNNSKRHENQPNDFISCPGLLPKPFLADLDNFITKDIELSNPCPFCGLKIKLFDDVVTQKSVVSHLGCYLDSFSKDLFELMSSKYQFIRNRT
jgi:hypothetical protein